MGPAPLHLETRRSPFRCPAVGYELLDELDDDRLLDDLVDGEPDEPVRLTLFTPPPPGAPSG